MACLCLAALMALAGGELAAQPALTDSQRVQIAIEALDRLDGADIESNAALKNALTKVLDATRGTPEYVQLVRKFHVEEQGANLLEVAVSHPAEDAGIEAARLLVAGGDAELLKETLHGTNSVRATRAAEALGNTGDQRMVALLLPLVNAEKADGAARRQAVRSLCRVEQGARELVSLAESGGLPEDVKFTATTELNQVRWAEIKARAARALPPPVAANTEQLPPMAELVKRKGNAARGAEVFTRPQVGCANCHRVNGAGAEVGPGLSEIGTKLGREAIYESILDPSAGIAFGFETWQIDLRSGDEAYGLIVSETTDEITVKDSKAILSRVRKSDIASRRQLKVSLMPAGLQQTMSTQDLVDLVEYLSSLKQAAAR